MNEYELLLQNGDLRSIGNSNSVVEMIDDQQKFDTLFQLLYNADRKLVMRAADALEKVAVMHPNYLISHKKELINFMTNANHIEMKWHLALMIGRLNLSGSDLRKVWQILSHWVHDRKESNIVRVNSLQTLFELSKQHSTLKIEFNLMVDTLIKQDIPSIQARIRKIQGLTKKSTR